jgi:hypothetical protein
MIQKYRFTIDVEVDIDEHAIRLEPTPVDGEFDTERKTYGKTLLDAVLRHPSLPLSRKKNVIALIIEGGLSPEDFGVEDDSFELVKDVALELPGEAGQYYQEAHDALTPDHDGGPDRWEGGCLIESMEEVLDVVFGDIVHVKGSCVLIDDGLGSN